MAQAVSKLYVSRKVFMKRRVNWNTVCSAIQDCPGETFGVMTSDNPVDCFEPASVLDV